MKLWRISKKADRQARDLEAVANTERDVGRIDTGSRCHAAQKAVAARCDLALALVVETGLHGVQVGALGQRVAVIKIPNINNNN